MRFSLRLPTIFVAWLWFVVLPPAARAQDSSNPRAQTTHTDAAPAEVVLPGPLRSLLRMAGISQKASNDEIVPLLARNTYVQGYEGWKSASRQTEFLILLWRYVNQSKELAEFAGPNRVVHLSNCDAAPQLLHILGYRLREECGQNDASLVTYDAERAFLTTDSGFPLPALEETLRKNKEFNYPYPASKVPILFTEDEWIKAKPSKRISSGLVEALLRDPELARLYWAMYRMDPESRETLRRSFGLARLLPYAAVLDFYGTHIFVRSGRVLVPGGVSAESGWKELAGASPDSPDFVLKLLAKDKGWLAAYFDALQRVNPEQQKHFTDSRSLKMYYAAFRGPDPVTDAARPAFRPAPGLLLLLTRTQWDRDEQPLVPGGLGVWKEILAQKSDSKVVREWGKRAAHFSHPDQLLEAMFAFSRVDTEATPLQTYLLFSELESSRASGHQLRPDTYRLLAKRFDDFSEQYLIFSEFPELDDASIVAFVNAAVAVDKISNHTLRGNAMGTFQACTGLWEILARQRQIPSTKFNQSWQAVIAQFAKIASPAQLFDAGEKSLAELVSATGSSGGISQDELIELLAGPSQPTAESRRVHEELAAQIRSVMDGQRLVSLDTLLGLSNGLSGIEGGSANANSLLPLAGELREFEMPRPIFTSSERTEWAAGMYNNRHTELQMQTDLAKVLKSASPSRAQLEEARGELAPFLRDNLVGLNYAYYEPPGSQMLRANPLFVRSHDFAGETVTGVEGLWHAPQLFGEGSPAGGGAHLVGSLADLPYVLSEAEQDFIAPENVQALIWREAVPGLLTNAIFPRWWNVTRTELHAVALYQIAGEELVSSAASDEHVREKVIAILSERMLPQRASRLERSLREGDSSAALNEVTPADKLHLTAEFRKRFPNDATVWGPSGKELQQLSESNAQEVSWERLSRDFGVPHKTLAQTYAPELLNVKPFPAFSGYSSRLMAESWDSNNLYWARLADEKGYAPVELNRLVPELTRHMVAKIFATEFEDWGALLRAMRETGDDFRKGKIVVFPGVSTTTEESAIR
jgi:hypothetical protein